MTWVVENGSYTVNDTVVRITDKNGNERELTLCQKWPIRRPRPVQTRMPAQRPLITGMRVVDTMFPIAKGGAAAIPGGFRYFSPNWLTQGRTSAGRSLYPLL